MCLLSNSLPVNRILVRLHAPPFEELTHAAGNTKHTYYMRAMEPTTGYLLSDSSRLLRRAFDERVRGLGLTAAQARLVISLVKFPDKNQSFHADRMEMEPITLTRMIDRMADSGWVERLPDPCDRRARILHLTPKSQAVIAGLRERIDELMTDMLVGFSDSETQDLNRLLGKISDNLSAERHLTKEAAHG